MITREEALQKYGDVLCYFSSYYKYSFTFSGEAKDGAKICFSYGGDSGDIYKFVVEAKTPFVLKDFINDSYVTVEKDGLEIFKLDKAW